MTETATGAPVALHDLLDHCAGIEPGQRVLIVAARDGLDGGPNLVDEATVAGMEAGVRKRGAHPRVLWVDLPDQPHAWKVPAEVKAGLAEADLFISHAFDLPFEELYELREILGERGVPMVRNMATTEPLLASAWARTPYELVSEIRFRAASFYREELTWKLAHPNGTHLEGRIGSPIAPFKHYAERRTEGLYRPFPEGVFTPVTVLDTEGVLVFDRTLSWWARYIGVRPRFAEPVRITVKRQRITRIEGGHEAERLRSSLAFLSARLGTAVYEIAGLHGGVHPHARVTAQECPNIAYREFIEHHHACSTHLHLGRNPGGAGYPYMLHITAELRGATLQVGDGLVCDAGRLAALDHADVRAIAARYPDRPGLQGDAPS